MKNFPNPIFTPVAETIKANREDERKSLVGGFADRLRSLAYKILDEKLNEGEIQQLLIGEAENLENQAAELNHV